MPVDGFVFSTAQTSWMRAELWGEDPALVGVRLGPSLGGQGLGISDAFSQTRLAAPLDAAPSVHGLPLMAGSIELAELYRTI